MKVYNILPSEKPKGIQRKGVKRKVESTPVKNGDKVEISSAARELQNSHSIIKKAKAALNNSPDVREDKIQQVRNKINTGYFSSNQIKNELAEKLLQNFGL